MKNQFKLIGLVAMVVFGAIVTGCSSPEADAGPASNGGTPVTEETKSRLQIADDSNGGGTNETSQAETPPEGN